MSTVRTATGRSGRLQRRAGLLAVLLLPAVLAGSVGTAAAAGGQVLTFGADTSGQLGNGPGGSSPTPSVVLSGASDVAGGREFGLALVGRSVYAWGEDSKGQVGNGLPLVDQQSPVQLTALPPAAAVATGHYHALVLLADGGVRAWGFNSRGQLGPAAGSAVKSASPVAVAFGSPVRQVAGGRAHSIALLSDGSVWTWGDNGSGQLGRGGADDADHPAPAKVAGLPRMRFVAGGRDSTFAIGTDGRLWAWGSNDHGQLGVGSAADTVLTPTVVIGGVAEVESGADHTVALLSSGALRSWGRNGYGQLGVTGSADRTSPVPVPGLPLLRDVFVGRDHTLAIARDGRVFTWGRNDGGQLGVSPSGTPQSSTPLVIPALAGATDAGGGQVHSVVLR